MKPCVIMSQDDHKNIRIRIAHAIHVLDHARVSKNDREYVVKTLRAALEDMDKEEI